MTQEISGKTSKSRERLSLLFRETGELFTVDEGAKALGLANDEAAKTLARWRKQGWLTRIKRGLYAAVPIDAATSGQALEEAWILVPELFGSSYIGGWTAAQHWNLTEQIFRDICVFSSAAVAKKKQTIHNVSFVVNHIVPDNLFGTKPVWKRGKKIMVSDPTKTIIDMLSNPAAGGGIQHIVDCVKEYLRSEHCDIAQLIDYGMKLGNGAVFKRLGYISSQIPGNSILTSLCEEHLTKGNAQFDPSLKSNRLITKWRLFVPPQFQINSERT